MVWDLESVIQGQAESWVSCVTVSRLRERISLLCVYLVGGSEEV